LGIFLVLMVLLWARVLIAAPPSASWPKTFSDEFNGSSLDSSKWSSGSLPWGGRHHNNEYASYIMPGDSYVNGGSLWLRSRKATGGEFGGYPYSEGFVHSQGKLNYTYGYVEIRSRFPTGKGLWPAFWTLSWEAGWPPEFDIAEYFGTDDRMHMGLAYSSGGTQWNSSNFYGEGVAGWHTWALEWGPGYAIWYKDGVLKKAIYASYVPSVPMYIILNSGVRWDADGSTPFPNYFEVDYFRKYNPPSAVVNDNTTGTANNQFNYVGAWGYSSQANAFFNDNHYSSTTDAYVELKFTGNRIDLHGAKAPNHGIAAVSIDGGPETLVDYYAPSRRERAFVWSAAGLPAGTKTLKVRVTGTRNAASTGNSIAIDRVTIWNVSGFLNGPLIGTDGSYQDQGNTKEQAMDGDLGSFFDAPITDGAWVGRDLGTPKRITKVRYAPRNGYPGRMNGGIFQGANVADFSDAVDLFTISGSPLEETVTDQNIANTNGFRYVRYLGPAASQGNVAVVEFYGSEPESYNGTWTADADGNWSDVTKWSGGVVANGADSTANFSTINITANRTITLDSARSITTLRFGDTSGAQNWTLAASEGSVLTLDAGAATSPLIAVNQNTATILAPLDGVSGFTKNGGGTLVLSGENALSGTVYLDRWADGSSLNDGAVRVTDSSSLANVTQFAIRNTSVTTGGGRLELDGTDARSFRGRAVADHHAQQ
jgi:autotransporter-associated beta strand protein